MRITSTVTLLIVSLLTTNLHAQDHTARGAGLGGAAGAIIGGIIGHQNDETPEGALIGGAVGAIAGAAIGNAKDRQIRDVQQYQWQQQQHYQAQQQYQQQLQRAISMNDVISLTRSGVSDSVIIGQINNGGVTSRVGVSEIIALHQQGVSEVVINSMQRAPLAGEVVASRPSVGTYQAAVPQTRVIVQPRPVVVREIHVEPPCPHGAPYYRHARHHYQYHH